ncbi:hypothetical protein HY091_02745 [Candidatus Kaiserbacteria bacterium]|nr:hypothetical protein [Candidatus Kaiserbacteria bacterium]
MVGRLFERLATPVRGLHQAAYLLAALTLASQALALLRDRTFAHAFGAGHVLDLYYAAFRIPDLVFALVASLVSAYVLIPRIAGLDREATRRLISESSSFLLIAGGTLCLVLAIFAPTLLFILYPDFAASPLRDPFILLTRILLLQPIILGISGIVTSVTQVHRRFVLFALSPVLYNLGIILGTVFLYPRFGLPGIGIGVVAGALAHAAIHIPVLRNAGVLPRLTLPRVRDLLPLIRDSIPRSLALGMGSLTALVLTAFASRIGTGSVSVFTFAFNLEAVPLALIGASYAVAAFPALSEASALRDKEEFTRVLVASARHIILWSTVFLGLIVVLRAHIVRVVLGTGAFGWGPTRLTAALLALLVLGLLAQGLVLLFSRALYAAKQSWRPLLYQFTGGALTVLFALYFLSLPATGLPAELATWLRVGDVAGSRILLVALASTIGQIFLLALSLIALRKEAPQLTSRLLAPLAGGLLAAVAGGAATYGILTIEGGIAPLTTLVAVATEGLVAGAVGLAASAAVLSLIGNEEFRDVTASLRRFAEARLFLPPSAEEPAHH